MAHGGRRHGIEREGEAARLLVRLSAEDRARLEALALAWECSLAEVVRRLVRGVGR